MTRSIAFKGYYRLRIWRDRWIGNWRRKRFIWFDAPSHRQFSLGKGAFFHVPVRSEGEGCLVIGEGNQFGYGKAPKLGEGTILLQPRGKSSEIWIGNGNAFSNNVSVIANKAVKIGHFCQIGDFVSVFD